MVLFVLKDNLSVYANGNIVGKLAFGDRIYADSIGKEYTLLKNNTLVQTAYVTR